MADPHVLVVGGGFGGLEAVRSLRKVRARVTLVDKRNFHLFQPLLYQVATGGLSPANIAAPLRDILAAQQHTRVLLAEVTGVDLARRRAILRDGEIPWDYLVLAPGAGQNYFGHPEWEALAPSLKTVEDATDIRRRILYAFEAAEREEDPERIRAWLTFVVVGAGPTGVEMAGAIAEIACDTLRGEYRSIDPRKARILLVEGLDRVLPPYPPSLSTRAHRALARRGVEILLRSLLTDVQPDHVVIRQGEEARRVDTRTVIWAAGVQAAPLCQAIGEAAGAPLDRAGRVVVAPDCSVPGHPDVFVIGDGASFAGPDEAPLPGVAQVAMQQGRHVARVIRSRIEGRPPPPRFQYRDRGTMSTIGRNSAVADLGWLRLWGYPAWLLWLFVHLAMIVQFGNKVLIFAQWAWNYFTRNRSARLITWKERP